MTTPPDPQMRASDADRDQVAEALREHCAMGRITVDELQERLEAVYASKTYGELAQVTADLPEEDLHQRSAVPAPVGGPASVPAPRSQGKVARQAVTTTLWAVWATVSAINFTVWLALALTGELVYPWWIWVAGPWGAVLLAGTLLGGRRNR